MAVQKLSISLDPELADRLKEAAEAEGEPVSTWVADALEDRLRLLEAKRAVLWYEEQYGEITDEEMAEARRKWLD